MGSENSSLSHLCSPQTPADSNAVSQVNAEITRHQKPKRKRPKPMTQTYQQLNELDIDHKTNHNITEFELDQKYKEEEYTKMQRELKTAKNEIQRVITQYNLQIDTINANHNKLRDKYDKVLSQKSILLQQLQDSIKQYELLRSSQTTSNLEHEAEIHEYKTSTLKLQHDRNKSSLEIDKYKESTMKLQHQLQQQYAEYAQQTEELNKLQNTVRTLKEENNKLKDERQSIYNNSNQYKQNDNTSNDEEITRLKTQIIALKKEKSEIDEINNKLQSKLDETENLQKMAVKKMEEVKNKYESEEKQNNNHSHKYTKSLADTTRQIEVLYDEGSRAKSLFLCTKQEKIDNKDMSFSKWLETNLNEKATKSLWSKLNSNTANTAVLLSLLGYTAMIYKTKLHQTRTNTKEAPNIDVTKIKAYVEHLAVWIIRNKGAPTVKEEVCVKMDDGDIIKEEVVKYKLSLTREEFRNNISDWIREYVEDQGVLENVI